ncbi:hypothetical protein A9W93_19850 [Mycobacterium colombiense]|nr:hypothetical protein A9W93_19850 [Mycobacterium colombiense]
MGFADRVNKLTDEELREDIERYDSVRLSLSDPTRYWDDYWRVVYFSDNVGLAMPINEKDHDGGLSMVLGTVAEYQLELALGGRFVRGGITRGALYADHSFITGEALVCAVLLEKKAIYPRIVLDQKCRDLAIQEIKVWAEAGAQLELRKLDPQQLLLRDGEDVVLNYLGLLLTGEDWNVELCLVLHRDWVRQKLDRYKDNDKLAAKYRWVADYHDFFVTQVAWFPQYLIGSDQEHRFASFSLDWLAAGLDARPVSSEILARFEHECAKTDISHLTRGIRDEVTLDEVEMDTTVPGFLRGAAKGDRVRNSIRHSCELLMADCDQDVVADVGPGIAQIVQDSQLIVEAAPSAAFRLSGSSSRRVLDLLELLDKGLRILRTDHRATSVALQGLSRCARMVHVDIDPRSLDWKVPRERDETR